MSTRVSWTSGFSKALGIGLALASLLAIVPAQADKRVALVVGNAAYQNIPRLANPASDARLMADTLRSLGFVLVGGGALLDLDEGNFRRAVQNFGTQLQGADVGLFYFAGHGVQVRGANYLVPIGANPTREADVDFQMLDANLVLRQMEGAGTKLNLVILDACRNNPFGGRGLRAVDSGLAQMRAPEGTLISFATQPGNVAQDGAGGNSPYTNALAEKMRRPGLGIFDVFNEVGLAVMEATADAQQPWVSTSPIRGSFFFAGPPSGVAAPAVAPGPTADEIAWGFVRNTSDLAALGQFLAQFAGSSHRAEAEARIALLKQAAGGSVPVEQRSRPQPSGRDNSAAQIDAMVGDPPPLPNPSEMFAGRPSSRPATSPSSDVGKRIDEMVALAPMTDVPPDVRAPVPVPSQQPEVAPLSRAAAKGAAQKFAATCSTCHRSSRGIAKTKNGAELAKFLREHYATSAEDAGTLAAYLIWN